MKLKLEKLFYPLGGHTGGLLFFTLYFWFLRSNLFDSFNREILILLPCIFYMIPYWILLYQREHSILEWALAGFLVAGIWFTLFQDPAIFFGNLSAFVYASLFLFSVVPLALGREPFTMHFALKKAPNFVGKSKLFLNMNRVLSFLWSLLFGLSLLVVWAFERNFFLSNMIPVSLMLVGVILNKAIPFIYFGNPKNRNALSEKMPLELLVLGLEGRFHPEKLPEQATYFGLTVPGHARWRIQADREKLVVEVNPKDRADLEIEINEQDWRDLCGRKTTGANLVQEGKMKVRGNLILINLFRELFEAKEEPSQQQA